MKKFKNIFVCATMAVGALLTQSCGTESSFPDIGLVPDGEQNQNFEKFDMLPINVTLNYQDLFYATTNGKEPESRGTGSGAFDLVNDPTGFATHYLNSKFHILAYRKTKGGNGELAAPADFRLLMESGGNEDQKDCLLSTERTEYTGRTIDGITQHVGKVTRPHNMGGDLYTILNEKWESTDGNPADRAKEQTYYWSKKYANVGYDFFGYYTDNATIYSTTATEDQVSMSVEIDGTSDIMVGSAEDITDSLLIADFSKSVTEEATRKYILESGQGGYCTVGALAGVEPQIDLKHCLTQLIFKVCQMDEVSTINVNGIYIKTEDTGELIVAARDKEKIGLTATGEKKWKRMFNSMCKDLEYNKPVKVGDGMLLAPAETYDVQVYVTELDVNTTQEGSKENLDFYKEGKITIEGGFKAGVTYYVTVQMWGSTGIEILATLEPWKQGGEAGVVMPDEYDFSTIKDKK